jgi:predicted lipoprotein
MITFFYFCESLFRINRNNMLKRILAITLVAGLIYACSSSSGGDDDETIFVDTFDRAAMLTDLADNIIIPAYQDFASEMTSLKAAGQNFTASPDQTTLDALRTAWYNAYKTWQYVEMFNIGKAEELQFSFYMNVYPLTVADVENNIANGGYDLDAVNNQDAQGFPALDYLLYGVAANDADILAKFTTDTNAQGYKNYVTDVLNQMDGLTQQVLNDWTGSFRNAFIDNSGNTTTSSVNLLANDFIFYYEKALRANKIGIPAGIFSNNVLPDRVEAFYRSDISKDLALEALQAVQDFFNGKQYGGSATGESFRSYLVYLQRSDISNSITTQFASAETQINGLLDNFSQQVNTDNTQMTLAYDELQKAVVLLKVDMFQAFNVNVDFVDADGD